MKKLMISLCLGLIITFVVSSHFESVESALSSSVVRLHVIAESNRKEDQDLKLKVRDAVIKNTKDIFTDDDSIFAAKQDIINNLDNIKKIAEDEIKKNGYNYDVNVKFGKSDFPTKTYNDITLPAGSYDALKIEIGNAKGKNWWCVMFPPLCFVDGSSGELDENGKTFLKEKLTDEEYNLVLTEKRLPIKVEFKLYEIWQNGKQTINKLLSR